MKRTYIWANAEILCQYNNANTATRYYYLHDRLGSVRQIIDKDGLLKRYYTFDPFGNLRESSVGPPAAFPFMFTGQYYDFATGQYYLRARQYDPQLMRFTA